MMKPNNYIKFLISASIAYLAYIFMLWLAGIFEADFFKIDWYIFCKLCLVAFPIYIMIIVYNYDILLKSDFLILFSPLILWFFAAQFYSKSLVNGFLVEPEMVGLLSGLYLVTIPISKMKLNISRRSIRALSVVFLSLGVLAIVNFVPFIGE